jgi:hypothetical protein
MGNIKRTANPADIRRACITVGLADPKTRQDLDMFVFGILKVHEARESRCQTGERTFDEPGQKKYSSKAHSEGNT